MEAPRERLDRVAAIRAVVEERDAAHSRLGLPKAYTTLGALDALVVLFNRHWDTASGWCKKCREDAPCAEVRAGLELLGVIEKTETEGLENGAG